MDGLHLTGDPRGCAAARPAMVEPGALRTLCLSAIAQARLQPVGERFHRFPDAGGVTAWQRHELRRGQVAR
jgi:S-adenosylmethionine decarboxylase